MSVVIKELAYARIILHASRYPHCSVNGILLSPLSDSKDKSLIICNAIPLFHHSLTLTPMLEVAMNQIERYCKDKKLCISGYYQINECVDKSCPTSCAYKIADKINDNNENSCLLMIKNMELASDNPMSALCLYRMQDNRWKDTSNCLCEIDHKSVIITQKLVSMKAHKYLVDFDCHLDDIRGSWPVDEVESLLIKMNKTTFSSCNNSNSL